MKTCPACRRSVADNAVHCPFCGTKLGDAKTLCGLPPVARAVGTPAGEAPPAAAGGSPQGAQPAGPAPGVGPSPAPRQPGATIPPAKAAPPQAAAGDADADDDDDDDDVDDEGGATVMIPALDPESVAQLLGAQAARSEPKARPAPETPDIGTAETELLLPVLPPSGKPVAVGVPASVAAQAKGLAPASASAARPASSTAPAAPRKQVVWGDMDDDDDDDDGEPDQPTMAIQALDWDLEAGKPTQPPEPEPEPEPAAVPHKRTPRTSASAPQTVPSPQPMPPPVAGLDEQNLVVGALLAGQATARKQATAAPPGKSAPLASSPPAAATPPVAQVVPTAASASAPQAMPEVAPIPPAAQAAPAAAPAAAASPPAARTAAQTPQPRPVPRERNAEVAAPAPAAARREEERAAKKGGGKVVFLVLILALLVLGGGAAGGYYFLVLQRIKVGFETEVIHLADEARFQVNLKIEQLSGRDEPLLVDFRGEQKEFRGKGSFSFDVQDADLQVGSNPVSAVVLAAKEKSKPLASIPVDLFLNYRFVATDTELEVGQKELSFTVTIPQGAALEIEGASVTGDGAEKTVTIEVERTIGPFHKQMQRKYPLELKLAITLSDGRTYKEPLTLELLLPQAELKVFLPAQLVTARDQLDLRGYVAPDDDALVTVNGKQPENMYDDGEFEWKQPLRPDKQEITFIASQPDRVARHAAVEVTRLGKAELKARRAEVLAEAEIWGKEAIVAPGPQDLLVRADGEWKGKKVKLSGQVLQVQLAGETLQGSVLVLSTCGGGGCPVLVQAKGPVDVLQGDKAAVFGVLSGKGKYRPTPASGEDEVPSIQGEYVVGD